MPSGRVLVALPGACEPSVLSGEAVVLSPELVLLSPAAVVTVVVLEVGVPGTNFVRNMSSLPSVGPSEPGARAQFV